MFAEKLGRLFNGLFSAKTQYITVPVSASAAPEARYVYEEVELPEDVFISTAAELADGSLRFISAVSRFLEGEDGGSAFVSESSLWALSSSGEAEKLAVLSDAASEERLSGFMLAPDGSFFCTAYERDTAAELLLRGAVYAGVYGLAACVSGTAELCVPESLRPARRAEKARTLR